MFAWHAVTRPSRRTTAPRNCASNGAPSSVALPRTASRPPVVAGPPVVVGPPADARGALLVVAEDEGLSPSLHAPSATPAPQITASNRRRCTALAYPPAGTPSIRPHPRRVGSVTRPLAQNRTDPFFRNLTDEPGVTPRGDNRPLP